MYAHAYTVSPEFEFSYYSIPRSEISMPNPYSLDLRWRIIWLYLAHQKSPSRIAALLHVSERTVRRYVALFYRSGDVRPRTRKNGPRRLLGEFEQLTLLRLILANPGIYLHELQDELVNMFGVPVCKATICRTLRYMGCTRQAMHHVAIQQSEVCRGRFMAEISMYDPSMLIWLDETGCDGRNTIRKYGYSLRGMPLTDHRLLVRGVRYSAIPIMSMEGIHDVYITEGSVEFVRSSLLPILMPFDNINPRSVVIMDNASIHHVQEVSNLIETQAGVRLHYLPPYSPDLNPAEGVFSQIKYIMKQNHKLFQVCSAPRGMIAFIF